MSVNVGDRVIIHAPSEPEDGLIGEIVVIRNGGFGVRVGDYQNLYFDHSELELVVDSPDPKLTLNSIADIFKSHPYPVEAVRDIKALLKEAGYEF